MVSQVTGSNLSLEYFFLRCSTNWPISLDLEKYFEKCTVIWKKWNNFWGNISCIKISRNLCCQSLDLSTLPALFFRYCINTRSSGSCLCKTNFRAPLSDISEPNFFGIMLIINVNVIKLSLLLFNFGVDLLIVLCIILVAKYV